MTWLSEEERNFWRVECQRSFYSFLTYCYGADKRFRQRPWFDPSIHKPLADWFQFHIDEWQNWRRQGIAQQKYLAILVPREVGKTTIITQAGLLWMHLHDADLSTYIGSEKTEFAVQWLAPIKAVLDGSDPKSRFTELYGNWYDTHRTWKTEQVVHSARYDLARKEPSFGTWGVEGGLTGMHPDVLCLDDPVSYEKMASHTGWLNTVNAHLVSLIPVLTADGLLVMPGTRYHDGDQFGRAFDPKLGLGIKSIAGMPIPDAKVQGDGRWDVFYMSGRDARVTSKEHPTGKPTCPRTWSEQRMRDFEKQDPLRYSAQVLNDPSNSEYNPLTLRQCRDCIIDEKEIPRRMVCTLHMDTAFKYLKRQAGGDETVLQVWGHPRDGSGDVFFLEGRGSNVWRAEDVCSQIVMLVQKYRRMGKRIVMITDEMEPGGKAGTWDLVLQSYFNAANTPMPQFKTLSRGGTKKLGRLIEAASFWSDNHVKIARNAPGQEALIEQMSRIGSSAHDDWADAAADVFHKDVYQVMRRTGNRQDVAENVGSRPWDEVLKTGRMPGGAKVTAQDYVEMHENVYGESAWEGHDDYQ
jgi:hypothetical protein